MNNQFINTRRTIEIGNPSWTQSDDAGLIGIGAEFARAPKIRSRRDGHEFINMCSCSYLGLDTNEDIVEGGVAGLRKAGSFYLSTARLRIHLAMLDEVEADLSDLFGVKAITTTSCGTATAGLLPLIASGILTGDVKPTMIFDRNCHFSMNLIKPICGDETEVLSAPHNDIDFVEEQCKKNKVVAYVCDGAYSMGGHAPIHELLRLQQKYGLFLYIDDSHSLSTLGARGEGFIRSQMDQLSERTIIVSSLAKAFGVSGGLIMFGPKSAIKVTERFGGPMAWSQHVNSAAMGGIMASARIHRSAELGARQRKLQENIAFFDQIIPTANAGSTLPIRVVPLPSESQAIACSRIVYDQGFYTSAVFFPIVERGTAGLRVMARADIGADDIARFAGVVKQAIAATGQ